MYYAKTLADNLEIYVDENTGLTYYPDGSVEDLTGARFYPTDELFDAFGYEELLDDEYLATRF